MEDAIKKIVFCLFRRDFSVFLRVQQMELGEVVLRIKGRDGGPI